MPKDILKKKIILNPSYILKNDIKRVVLATKVDHKIINPDSTPDTYTFIHPMFAILLSFFIGERTLEEDIKNISSYFNINEDDVKKIVLKFINNDKIIAVEYDGEFFYFPKNILIINRSNNYRMDLTPNNFTDIVEVDVKSNRLNLPLSVSILINNRCTTDCIYCYADKRIIQDCTIPLSRIKELIIEAKEMNFLDFDLKGGEIFLYKHWNELLKLIFDAGYTTYISTKYPLKKEDITKLKVLGVEEIQISLDSIYEEDLKKSLCVGSKYHRQMLETIKMLDQAKIEIKIKAVISNQIYNLERIKDFINYFEQYNYVKIVEITIPGHSSFKSLEEVQAFKLKRQQIVDLKEMVLKLQSLYHFKLRIDNANIEPDNITFDEKKSKFKKRAVCTGNQSSFMILPNGDVTICEEVYFNPNLILGNILNTSIVDVWKSDKAKRMFYITQDQFPSDSACSICSEFDACRHGAGVCWSDVIASYGSGNWMYPSPDCSLSPLPLFNTNNESINQ